MDILYLMILCSVSLALVFLIVFIINAKKGQFEDDQSPAVRILFDDELNPASEENKKEDQDSDLKDKIEEKSE